MKATATAKVIGTIVLAGAALFALSAGSALAAPPPPFDLGHDLVQPSVPLDPGSVLGDPPVIDYCQTHICRSVHPIDPCIILDNCGTNDSSVDPTVTPTDEPTATPTDEPTAVPTTAPTDVPTVIPTNVPPTATPVVAQPGNLPSAGSDGGIMNDVGSGVVALAGMSLGAMAIAWMLFFAARKRAQTER